MNEPALHVFLVAGEASGDALGARLMAALTEQTNGCIRFSGVGGPEMATQGLVSLFPYAELSVMGLVEVLPSAVNILRRMRQVAAAVRQEQPHVLVTIDAPAFCFGVVKRLRKHTIPRVHYVAPTVWAWRPNRVHKFRRHFDHLLALLPFEPPYFERVGLPCTFVGHPVVENNIEDGAGSDFRRRHGIASQTTVLCVLPGSRRGEVSRLLKPFGEAIRIVGDRHQDMTLLVPTVSQVADTVRAAVAAWPLRTIVVEQALERSAAMSASTVALAASGTASLELAARHVPTVVGYRVAPITALILRRLVRIRYASIVNILADREIVPEFLQEKCRPQELADTISAILNDPRRRQSILAGQDKALTKLTGTSPPSHCAAQTVLTIAHQWSRRAARL